jgi:hypothetical protein
MQIWSVTEIEHCNYCESRKHANLYTFTVRNTERPKSSLNYSVTCTQKYIRKCVYFLNVFTKITENEILRAQYETHNAVIPLHKLTDMFKSEHSCQYERIFELTDFRDTP